MSTYRINGQDMRCQFCGGTDFAERNVQLNTPRMSLFDLDWLNKSAEGLICSTCGYIHMFLKKGVVQQAGG